MNLEPIKKALEGRIDYEGQELSKVVAYAILSFSGVLAYIVSLVSSSIKLGLIVFGFGYLLTLLAVVPPWPIYRKHEIKWLPVRRLKTT